MQKRYAVYKNENTGEVAIFELPPGEKPIHIVLEDSSTYERTGPVFEASSDEEALEHLSRR